MLRPLSYELAPQGEFAERGGVGVGLGVGFGVWFEFWVELEVVGVGTGIGVVGICMEIAWHCPLV